MPKYTIRQATPTGKTDAMYGTEYIVHFNEDQREVKMSRKKAIAEGDEENGSIVDGKYGAYFKKDPFVPAPQGQAPAPQSVPSSSSSVSPSYQPRKDNSDGMRQGMCINNAANYVNVIGGEALGAEEWAKDVHAFANALYALGDLGQEVETTLEENVANIFGSADNPKPAVPANA